MVVVLFLYTTYTALPSTSLTALQASFVELINNIQSSSKRYCISSDFAVRLCQYISSYIINSHTIKQKLHASEAVYLCFGAQNDCCEGMMAIIEKLLTPTNVISLLLHEHLLSNAFELQMPYKCEEVFSTTINKLAHCCSVVMKLF